MSFLPLEDQWGRTLKPEENKNDLVPKYGMCGTGRCGVMLVLLFSDWLKKLSCVVCCSIVVLMSNRCHRRPGEEPPHMISCCVLN